MNRLYYNTIYNPCNKNNSPKNLHSSINIGHPWLKGQIPPTIPNNSTLFKNPFFGSGDYSNIMNSMFTTNITTTSSNKMERLPIVKPPSMNDGIDGYRIYSRSTMVEIAWQYDLKQWKEILGQNPLNNFGILLTLQREKKNHVDNHIDESIDSGYVNDFYDNSSYFNYLTQSSAYSTNYKNNNDGRSFISNSQSNGYYNDFSSLPYNVKNEGSFKGGSNEVLSNNLKGLFKPGVTLSSYGTKYQNSINTTSKFPEMKKLWTSAYSNLLQNDSNNSEANVYKVFLDKLIKQMTVKSSHSTTSKTKSSQNTVVNLSDIENEQHTYTRSEMLKISKKYTPEGWANYLIDNFSNNSIIMDHLRRDIFIVDSHPMRPKMSKEVKAIFKKYRNKKKKC